MNIIQLYIRINATKKGGRRNNRQVAIASPPINPTDPLYFCSGSLTNQITYNIAPCRLCITFCCIYCPISVMHLGMLYILPHVGYVSRYVVYIAICRICITFVVYIAPYRLCILVCCIYCPMSVIQHNMIYNRRGAIYTTYRDT